MSGDRPERRLVEEQEPRLRHQRARDRHHLLLAAGERAGGRIELLDQRGKQRAYALDATRARARVPSGR